MEKLPRFYAAMVLYFPVDVPQKELVAILGDCCTFKRYDRENFLEVTVCEVDKVRCWEVDEVLTQLFEMCDLECIKSVANRYNGRVVIDISFVHYDKYPALIFDGKVMQTIHELQASIGIDPY